MNVKEEKPLQYYTAPFVNGLYKKPEKVDVSSELRQKPTRLNYHNRLETQLFGTAPYQTLGHMKFTDTESKLFQGETFSGSCRNILTEQEFDTKEFIEHKSIFPVDPSRLSKSTRVDIRNEMSKNNRM